MRPGRKLRDASRRAKREYLRRIVCAEMKDHEGGSMYGDTSGGYDRAWQQEGEELRRRPIGFRA